MANDRDPLERAFWHVQGLIEIVGAERRRALNTPRDERWVNFGIVEAGADTNSAIALIRDFFDDVQFLLIHLALLHLASTFEMEANKQLRTFVGAARKAGRSTSRDKSSWRENIVRHKFEGLDDVFALLGLSEEDSRSSKLIRDARNNFSHGVKLESTPAITAEDARLLLSRWLEMLP